MQPVCVACRLVMTVAGTGAAVEEMRRDDAPYRIWSADLFECPLCGVQVIGAFGDSPVSEHFRTDYAMFRHGVTHRFWHRQEEQPLKPDVVRFDPEFPKASKSIP